MRTSRTDLMATAVAGALVGALSVWSGTGHASDAVAAYLSSTLGVVLMYALIMIAAPATRLTIPFVRYLPVGILVIAVVSWLGLHGADWSIWPVLIVSWLLGGAHTFLWITIRKRSGRAAPDGQ
jgi:hypothetical protein